MMKLSYDWNRRMMAVTAAGSWKNDACAGVIGIEGIADTVVSQDQMEQKKGNWTVQKEEFS